MEHRQAARGPGAPELGLMAGTTPSESVRHSSIVRVAPCPPYDDDDAPCFACSLRLLVSRTGVLLKDSVVFLTDPGVFLKNPGVPGNRPRDPLRSTGRARETNLHQTSAPETNSKAVSCPFHILGIPRRLPDSGLRDGGLVIR